MYLTRITQPPCNNSRHLWVHAFEGLQSQAVKNLTAWVQALPLLLDNVFSLCLYFFTHKHG